MLDNHNSTLQYISHMEPALDGKLQARFTYFLELNSHGRKQARDESCNAESFVTLLAGVDKDNVSIQFGLLLEHPGC
jgi:hypothetical protein